MSRIDELIEQMRELEEEMQVEFAKRRGDFRFVVERRRIQFSEEVAALQRGSKVGLFRYVTGASISTVTRACGGAGKAGVLSTSPHRTSSCRVTGRWRRRAALS